MSTPHDSPEDHRLRSRLAAAYEVHPPAHLTARVEDLARPRVSPGKVSPGTVSPNRVSPNPATTSRPLLGDLLAPAAGIVLLVSFLGGSVPLLRGLLADGGIARGGAGLPEVAGLSALGPALAALLVPLLLGWLFELSRGAPLLRRFLR